MGYTDDWESLMNGVFGPGGKLRFDTQKTPPEKPGIPMTDGTPMACRQKNAAAFLAGDVQTSVMAHYAPGLFSTKQKLHSRHPAPDEDTAAVLELVEWREDAPYG